MAFPFCLICRGGQGWCVGWWDAVGSLTWRCCFANVLCLKVLVLRIFGYSSKANDFDLTQAKAKIIKNPSWGAGFLIQPGRLLLNPQGSVALARPNSLGKKIGPLKSTLNKIEQARKVGRDRKKALAKLVCSSGDFFNFAPY